jgi:putative intracellular protease/amidase
VSARTGVCAGPVQLAHAPHRYGLCTTVLRARAMCANESGPGGARNAGPALTDNREGSSIVAHSIIRTALLAATAQAKR